MANQWHYCNDVTIDDIFDGKPDDLLLAFDDVLLATAEWEPNSIGAAKKAVVFTNKRAWLIVRPMSKLLDVAFYTGGPLVAPQIHKSSKFSPKGNKWRHQIRLNGPGQLSHEMVDLMRRGFDFAMR